MTRYCFDTSAFINPWIKLWPIDVVPSFWRKLEELAILDAVVVSEAVIWELKKKDDALLKWVNGSSFKSYPLTDGVQPRVRDILKEFPRLTDTRTGKGYADPFVIATAMVTGTKVVTTEDFGTHDKPRIPYVCRHYKVNCCNVLDLIREEQWAF